MQEICDYVTTWKTEKNQVLESCDADDVVKRRLEPPEYEQT